MTAPPSPVMKALGGIGTSSSPPFSAGAGAASVRGAGWMPVSCTIHAEYSSTTRLAIPVRRTIPLSSQMARLHRRTTSLPECETSRMVLPISRNSVNFRLHFTWNRTSPTDSASSTIRMSGSTLMAQAKATRTNMPLE